MGQNDITVYWLFYKGLRQYLGLWKFRTLKTEFYRWMVANGWPNICGICHKKIRTRKERSLDHIIPISICMELEMPGLIFDPRNFRVAHRDCNEMRSSNISDLPKKVRQALAEKRKNKAM